MVDVYFFIDYENIASLEIKPINLFKVTLKSVKSRKRKLLALQ